MVKYPRVWFFVPRGLRGYHQFKIVGDSRGLHFFCLRLIEAVGDYVKSVGLLEVAQDFFGMGKKVGLGRSSVHEILFKGGWDCSRISSSMGKYPWEPFAPQALLVDFSQVVVIPKLEVDRMERGEKLLEARNAQVLQGINLKEFRERFAYIPIVIP